MNHKIRKLLLTVLSLCLCFLIFQELISAEAAKELKITASTKVAGGGDFLKGESELSRLTHQSNIIRN